MCHKTAGLVANIFESAGIATVVVGTMEPLLRSVPRALITAHGDAPIGPPGDRARQREVTERAVALLRAASQRTLEQI